MSSDRYGTLAAIDLAGFAEIVAMRDMHSNGGQGGAAVALAMLRDALSLAEILAEQHQVR